MTSIIGEVTKLSERILEDLKQEGAKKAELDGLKSGIIQRNDEDAGAVKDYAERSSKLLKDLEGVKEQLIKAKKDNLCIRLSYERWKQTYESLDHLKDMKLVDSPTTLTELQS